MKIPVAIKILNETTGPKANVEFMDVSTDTRRSHFYPLLTTFKIKKKKKTPTSKYLLL